MILKELGFFFSLFLLPSSSLGIRTETPDFKTETGIVWKWTWVGTTGRGNWPECPCTLLLGMPRMQGPNCSLPMPLLRLIFVLSNLEGWGNISFWDKEQAFLFSTIKEMVFPNSMFLRCTTNQLHIQHLLGPLRYLCGAWKKGHQCKHYAMLLTVPWVITFFDSEPGVSSWPASMK